MTPSDALREEVEEAIRHQLIWLLEVSDERNQLERALNAVVLPILARLEQERDEAQARIAALESALREAERERDAALDTAAISEDNHP